MGHGEKYSMDMDAKCLRQVFAAENYICEEDLIITVSLALKLGRPLLVEGAPGVGKTEIAKILATALETELIRLQCYEGLDESKALYEWNYQAQLLKIQMIRESHGESSIEEELFSPRYLLERPLLKAIRSPQRSVLLIDEIDKTDEEFEAFLFELLSDFQVSIPEMGTVRAVHIPVVVLTSNQERELSDGLRRRCVYLYIDYPSQEKETEILQLKAPGISESLVWEITAAMKYLRQELALEKPPSTAEAIDWAVMLVDMECGELSPEIVQHTLGLLLKSHHDMAVFTQSIGCEGLCAMLQKRRIGVDSSQEVASLASVLKKKFNPF